MKDAEVDVRGDGDEIIGGPRLEIGAWRLGRQGVSITAWAAVDASRYGLRPTTIVCRTVSSLPPPASA